MLKIKILKTIHKGEDEARKLLPFISDCHVFGPEVAGMTEQLLIGFEQEWLRLLNSGMSRSQFNRGMKATSLSNDPDIEDICASGGLIPYGRKLDDYLYRAKMPKWHCERLTPDEAETVLQQIKLDAQLQREKGRMLLLGDVDGYLKAASQYLKNLQDHVDLRDKAIARCLETAEVPLRSLVKTYRESTKMTSFSEDRPLIYVVQIGARHSPEKYVTSNGSLNIQIVDLSENEKTLAEVIMDGYIQGKTVQDLRKELLVEGLFNLRKNLLNLKKPITISLSPDEIMQTSQTDLEGCITEFSRSAEMRKYAKALEQYNRSQGFYS